MTSPETLELEAVDAALAGRYVAPELADLALLLRDDRPQPTLQFATHLDRRVEAGFPARPKQRRDWGWLWRAAPVAALPAIIALVIGVGVLAGGGDDSGSGGDSGSSAGGSSAPSAADSSAGSSSSSSGSVAEQSKSSPRLAAPPNADLVKARKVQRAA